AEMEARRLGLVGEDLERLEHRDARAEHRRELARERLELALLDRRPGRELAAAALARGRLRPPEQPAAAGLADVDRCQVALAQVGDDVALRICGNGALDRAPGGVTCLEFERRCHGRVSPCR